MGFLAGLFRIVGIRGLVGLAVGLALMAGWERAPWGLRGRLTAAEASRGAKAAALKTAATALRTAARAIAERDRAIIDNAEGEALDAGATASFWKGQCRAAFDAGYAARRCTGGGADAGGVRDLREIWRSGAWSAAGRVPGEPERADR